MTNHPNRSGKGSSRNPKPEELIAFRLEAGLSELDAAKLLHTSLNKYKQWETAENAPNHQRMHPAFFDLLKCKVKELPK